MADISELVLDVKNRQAIQSIGAVDSELRKVGKTGLEVGKTIFAAYSFTKLLAVAKKMSNAFRDLTLVTRQFDRTFGKGNKAAVRGVQELIDKFHETERSAKKLVGIVGTRLSNFDFGKDQLVSMSVELSKIAEEVAIVFGQDLNQVSQKLTNALSGEVDGLKELSVTIDKSSVKFQKLVQDQLDAGAATKKAAEAMVIFNEIQRQTAQYSGMFESQANSISQALGDISNTLQSGLLAESGRILDKALVPSLVSINDFFSIDWVQKTGGFLTAVSVISAGLGGLTVFVSKIGSAVSAGLSSVIANTKEAIATSVETKSKAKNKALFDVALNYWQEQANKTAKALSSKDTDLSARLKNRELQIEALKELDFLKKSKKDFLSKATKDSKDYAKQLAATMATDVRTTLKEFQAAELTVNDQFDLFFNTLASKLMHHFGVLYSGISTTISTLAKPLKAGFLRLLPSVSEFFDHFDAKLEHGFKALNGKLDKFTDWIIAKSGKIFNKLSESFFSGLAASSGRSAAKEVGAKIAEKIGEGVNSAVTGAAGGAAAGGKLKVIAEAFKKLVSKVGGWVGSLAAILVKSIGYLTGLLTGFVAQATAVFAGIGVVVANGAALIAREFGSVWATKFLNVEGEILTNINISVSTFFEKLKNLFTFDGWNTDGELRADKAQAVNRMFARTDAAIASTNQEIENYYDNLNFSAMNPLAKAKEAKKLFAQRDKEWRSAEAALQKIQAEVGNVQLDGSIDPDDPKLKDLEKRRAQIQEHRAKAWRARLAAEKRNSDAQKELTSYLEKQAEDADKQRAFKLKQLKALKDTTLDYYKALYGNFVWFKDQALELFESVKKVPTKFKLNVIDEQMEKLKRSFTFREGDSLVEGYKELGELEMERFRLQMDHLNRESDAIRESNRFIVDLMQKTAGYKAQGVGGMAANTGEGYKFLTSAMQKFDSFNPLLAKQAEQSKVLEQKKVSLAQSTLNVIKSIKKSIDSNTQKAPGGGDAIIVVN